MVKDLWGIVQHWATLILTLKWPCSDVLWAFQGAWNIGPRSQGARILLLATNRTSFNDKHRGVLIWLLKMSTCSFTAVERFSIWLYRCNLASGTPVLSLPGVRNIATIASVAAKQHRQAKPINTDIWHIRKTDMPSQLGLTRVGKQTCVGKLFLSFLSCRCEKEKSQLGA